jgi:C-8 sterol isomerase
MLTSSFLVGFADTFSSTLDWYNLWKTVKMTALGMGKQAMRGKF